MEDGMSDLDHIAAEFESMLPKHDASLHIEHNDHKSNYNTVAKELEWYGDRYTWRSDEEKQAAIDTNDFWSCQWYPDTPVGFHCVAAPTLAKLLAYLAEHRLTP